jgi:hypothetical protein
MGFKNEHKAFKVTSIKETKTHITPSIEMKTGRLVTAQNILEHHKVSWVANSPDVFPTDPEENEITYKDGGLWIYKKVGEILQWVAITAGGDSGTTVNATNVIEDSSHRFVTDDQLTVIQELEQGQIPAPKIVQDADHQFLNQTQVDIVNDLVEGVEIDGGDLQ